MPDLFDHNAREYYDRNAPLAERMRPRELAEVVGQPQLIGEGAFLRRMIETDRLQSVILWGPPGTGKTTLARLVAGTSGRRFVATSAIASGVAEVKRILAEARERLRHEQRGTVLFLDEIHRFNKAQQDALLHGVEDGTLTLIGATTENPSFEVNGALLSRAQVLVLEPLDDAALRSLLQRALTDTERGLGERQLQLDDGGEESLIRLAAGDARALLNFLELAALLAESSETALLTAELVQEAAGRRAVLYDKTGEEHYNVVSALIKSMRGSDPDAALYYLARMLDAGEDPVFIARRLVIFASEDVGNADPRALQLAVSATEAVRFIGMPEGFYPLSQCTLYLALAPKSNSAGQSYKRALGAVREYGALPVPLHLRNAPTKLMKGLGYGKAYQYPHDHPGGHVDERYLPEAIDSLRFYEPVPRGYEQRLAEWWAQRRKR